MGTPYFFPDTPMTAKTITNTVVPESERFAFVDRLFGISYVLKLEPTVFTMAERIAPDYSGAYWTFQALGNGGYIWHRVLTKSFPSPARTGKGVLGCCLLLYGRKNPAFDGAICITFNLTVGKALLG